MFVYSPISRNDSVSIVVTLDELIPMKFNNFNPSPVFIELNIL